MTEAYRITRMLVPVDGSEYARYAAEHAVRLAQSSGAEVVFLYVVDEQIAAELTEREGLDGAVARPLLLAQGQACLRDLARLAEEHGVAHRERLGEGDPCAVIADVARRESASLIVLGKLGRRGARRILMGSMTRRVIESSDRPVLVVTAAPPGESRLEGGPEPQESRGGHAD